jgi:hypothetical protein
MDNVRYINTLDENSGNPQHTASAATYIHLAECVWEAFIRLPCGMPTGDSMHMIHLVPYGTAASSQWLLLPAIHANSVCGG